MVPDRGWPFLTRPVGARQARSSGRATLGGAWIPQWPAHRGQSIAIARVFILDFDPNAVWTEAKMALARC
jgi:hypothetical protein